jgi:16S rRNA (adenine(1408)-N(1))-methyltransferase
MKILLGKKQNEIDSENLNKLIGNKSPIHIEVGTGSGRLILKNSKINPNGFYIGMDASAASMYENSVKAAKQAKKSKLCNALFTVASIEAPPKGLYGIADIITIILPWGSLRNGIVKACPLILGNLRKLAKLDTAIEIVVGYDEKTEKHEIERHLLPTISHEYLNSLSYNYLNAGIKICEIKSIANKELKLIESDWAKKLAYGSKRTMYKIDCKCI